MPEWNEGNIGGLYTLLACTDHLVMFAQPDTSKCTRWCVHTASDAFVCRCLQCFAGRPCISSSTFAIPHLIHSALAHLICPKCEWAISDLIQYTTHHPCRNKRANRGEEWAQMTTSVVWAVQYVFFLHLSFLLTTNSSHRFHHTILPLPHSLWWQQPPPPPSFTPNTSEGMLLVLWWHQTPPLPLFTSNTSEGHAPGSVIMTAPSSPLRAPNASERCVPGSLMMLNPSPLLICLKCEWGACSWFSDDNSPPPPLIHPKPLFLPHLPHTSERMFVYYYLFI